MTFVGKNGSGKTNVLEALNLIFQANLSRSFTSTNNLITFEYKIILLVNKKELQIIDSALLMDECLIEVYSNKGSTFQTKIISISGEEIYQISKEKSSFLIEEVQKNIKKRCFFLGNEDSRLMFIADKNQDWRYQSNINENLILEAYLKTYTDFEIQNDIMEKLAKGEKFDSKEISEGLEKLINQDIPGFDRGMFSRIKVSFANDKFSLVLVEKSGVEIDFRHTNTGRRWYYTFYFIKKCLRDGDLFIIDEPGSYLHPDAQSEILRELELLAQNGCKVIFTTHSPYLISPTLQHFYYVIMNEKGNTSLERYDMDNFSKVRYDLGLDLNDLVFGKNKTYILVEGKHDVEVLNTFIRLFGIDSSKYKIVSMNGESKLSAVYELAEEEELNFMVLLDADVKKHPIQKQRLKQIPVEKLVFAGEGTKEESIEALFYGDDAFKYLDQNKKRKKVAPEKIMRATNLQEFDDKTIEKFKELFKKLGIR